MKNGNIRISVIVCTYNGADRLKCVIDSLLGQNYDANRFEILIIDNDSNDNTRDVCEEIINSSRNKRIKYYFEKNKGLSHARNRGIKESKGQVVAFIDDDAIAAPDWILRIENALADNSIDAIGGKVLPIFRKPKPRWLSGDIDSVLTMLHLGEQIIPFEYPHIGPCGTNMAFQKRVFDEIGYFDPALGRRGKKLIGAEDTDIQRRLQLVGMKSVYFPDCIVYHHAPESRLTKSWVRKRFFYQGFSIALLDLKYEPFLSVINRDIKSIVIRKKIANTGSGLGKQSNRRGCFYYEAKIILYSSYLFFLVANVIKQFFTKPKRRLKSQKYCRKSE